MVIILPGNFRTIIILPGNFRAIMLPGNRRIAAVVEEGNCRIHSQSQVKAFALLEVWRIFCKANPAYLKKNYC